MPFDATGAYSHLFNWETEPVRNEKIYAARIQAELDGLASAVSFVRYDATNDNFRAGLNAGLSLTTGKYNVLIGPNAGAALTTSEGDIFIGRSAGAAATIGGGFSQHRVVIGDMAAPFATSFANVVAIARGAGYGMTTDLGTIAIGHGTMFYGGGTTDCIVIGDVTGGLAIDGSDPLGYGLLNDSDVYLFGTQGAKSSAAARTNAWGIGYRVKIPIKDNIAILGGSTMTMVATGASSFSLRERVDVSNGTGVTLTAAQIKKGIIFRTGPTPPFTDTFPTAADFVDGTVGEGGPITSWVFHYFNLTAGTATLATNTGISMTAANTIGPGETVEFLAQITNTASGTKAVTVDFIGRMPSIGGSVQAWDADLDAIAALTGTGLPTRTAANTWELSAFAANGTVATTMTSLGPAGANTTIQEWLTVKNAGGTVRYIPCY